MSSPIETITTPRLVGERITPAHFDEIALLHRDPLVMRTLSADGLPLADVAHRWDSMDCSMAWTRDSCSQVVKL